MDMIRSVDGGALRLISPYVHVRLESAPAGFAVLATPAGDDASHVAAHTLRVRQDPMLRARR